MPNFLFSWFSSMRVVWLLVLVAAATTALRVPLPGAHAQETPSDVAETPSEVSSDDEQQVVQKADEVLADAPQETSGNRTANPNPKINLLELLIRGGWLMAPIWILSVIVIAVAVERGLALRKSRVLPRRLVHALGEVSGQAAAFDPRAVYRLCQQYPSAAANVIRAMLFKIGRPHGEVERAATDASQREAARLYANVRTLNLAAAIAPLMGLLGTVWGMIKAFMATANMPVGANKAEYLAEGIYTALVTTFAGLAVAIPAAVLAHWFEGRIQVRLREIDELLFNLLPQVERFEGKLRVNQPPATAPPATGSADSERPAGHAATAK